MKDYLTIEGVSENKIEINRSVFITTISGISDFEQGKAFVKTISKRYSDATHNCYAIIGREEQKFSDDGEPQGTAGQPILKALKSKNLENVGCVVTRYFGGIKLGKGGLVQAYMRSAAEVAEKVNVIKMIYSSVGGLELSYNDYYLLKSAIGNMNFQILDTRYADFAQIDFAVPIGEREKAAELISELTLGKAKIIWQNDKYITF